MKTPAARRTRRRPAARRPQRHGRRVLQLRLRQGFIPIDPAWSTHHPWLKRAKVRVTTCADQRICAGCDAWADAAAPAPATWNAASWGRGGRSHCAEAFANAHTQRQRSLSAAIRSARSMPEWVRRISPTVDTVEDRARPRESSLVPNSPVDPARRAWPRRPRRKDQQCLAGWFAVPQQESSWFVRCRLRALPGRTSAPRRRCRRRT